MNVNRKDNRQLCEPDCAPSSIAVYISSTSPEIRWRISYKAWYAGESTNNEFVDRFFCTNCFSINQKKYHKVCVLTTAYLSGKKYIKFLN